MKFAVGTMKRENHQERKGKGSPDAFRDLRSRKAHQRCYPFKMSLLTASLGLVSALLTTSAQSTELVYQPTNPSFGGNSFNSSHLMGLADYQNQHKEDGASASSRYSDSPADQFVRQLQSRMLSSLAQQVNDAIFGEDAAESGRIVFGDQIISFNRGLEGVHLVIENTTDGSQTEVTVPTLQVN